MSEFYFDQEAADRAVQFFPECLVHVKGEKAGQPFHLHPSHAKIVSDLFGWKRANGTRRYRKAYIEIPRKNAKSTLAAGIAIYLLLCDHEKGGEVYSAASTRDQASLVFNMAASMLRHSKTLSKHVSIRDSVKRILHKKSDSFYRAISADAEGAHGFNANGIIFDEVHTQPNRDLWEVLDTSTGARAQPLTFAITTAGHDKASICWELHQYAKAIIGGEIIDDSFYAVIYGADYDDDWQSESTWFKANPLLGEAVSLDYIREQCKRAQEQPAFQNSFRRLHLNQWTEQESRLIPMQQWDKCQRNADIKDFDGMVCFAGLDLSSTRDVTAFVLLFPRADGVSVFPYFWIPEENISKRAAQDQRVIRAFADAGFVEVTEGNEVDVMRVAERIVEISAPFDLRRIGFDPWNAAGPTQRMKELGLPEDVLIKMPQGTATYNEPIKQLLSMLGSQRFHHDGNKVLRWMASNAAGLEDSNGNLKFHKGKSGDKIDGMTALGMALALYLTENPESSAYKTAGSGVIFF